jgi:hypothetical protein
MATYLILREDLVPFFLPCLFFYLFLLLEAPGISATPAEDNLRYFNVIIAGPSGSPFEGMKVLKLISINRLKRWNLQARIVLD